MRDIFCQGGVLLIIENKKKLDRTHACAWPPAGNLPPTISKQHAHPPLTVPSGGYQILPAGHVQQLKCVAGNAHTSESRHQRTCTYLEPSSIKKLFDYHYTTRRCGYSNTPCMYAGQPAGTSTLSSELSFQFTSSRVLVRKNFVPDCLHSSSFLCPLFLFFFPPLAYRDGCRFHQAISIYFVQNTNST